MGFPALIFIIYVLFTHYVQFSAFFIIVLLIATLGMLNKKSLWMNSTKIILFGLIMYFILFSNLALLPEQLARRSFGGRERLIEPEHPKIVEFKDDFCDWHVQRFNVDFGEMPEDAIEDLELKLYRVDYYVRTVRAEYKYDIDSGYAYYDHIPTIDEIFSSDFDGDGKLEDDCDGLSILTTSLLISMGYNAYISECEWHWHTLVFPDGANPREIAGFDQAIYLYNSQKRPSYFIFNNEETIIPSNRPLYVSFFEIFTGARTYENYVIRIFNGYYIDLPIFLYIPFLFLISSLLGAAIFYYMKIGNRATDKEKRKETKKNIKITLLLGSLICFLFFIIYWFTITGLASWCNLIVTIGIASSFRISQYFLK